VAAATGAPNGLQKPAEIHHISAMAKRSKRSVRKPSAWEIIAITRSPAHHYGVVYAAEEQAALAKAIEEFQITKPHEQRKLMARPKGPKSP
jgi:hypothetical protein